MAQETFLEKVRDWLGGIAFSIFLWSIEMTLEEYVDAIVAESRLTQRAQDVCGTCDGAEMVREWGKWKVCPDCKDHTRQ